MNTPTSISSKQYPDFIKTNILFKLYPEVDKVFPKIGLDNCQEEISEDFINKNAHQQLLITLKKLGSLKSNIEASLCVVKCYLYSIGRYETDEETKKRIKSVSSLLQNLTKLIDWVKKRSDKCIVMKRNSVKAILPEALDFNLNGKKVSFKKDSCLLSVIEIALDAIATADSTMLSLIQSAKIKETFVKNTKIPSNTEIVFSSTGQKGLWDIATMSMRGVSSCQRWGNAKHRSKVIGTMLDPYAGVLYLTSNSNTKYGSKMIKRSVVRLIINKTTKKPALLIERVYPHTKDNPDINETTLALFTDFLNKKTGNKFDILYGERKVGISKYAIPFTEQTSDIDATFGKKCLSYRDSGVGYADIKSFKDINKCQF
jgi:hypothetical protein